MDAAKTLNDEFISKQPGYVSWKQVVDTKGIWADMCTFETMEDLEKFKEISKKPGENAKKFYSFINLMSCKQHIFTVERDY